MKLTPKLTLVFVLFAAALLAVVDVVAYSSGRDALEAATSAELRGTAIEKQASLEAWVARGQSALAAIAALPPLGHYLETLSAAPGGTTATVRAAHDMVVQDLRPFSGPGSTGEFVDLFVLAPATGEVIASTDPSEEGQFKEDRPYFLQGRSGPYVQNVYYEPALGGPAMTSAVPVVVGGRLVGVLAGRLNLRELNAIIARRSGLRRTDEAFLVNTSNLFVTQPRLLADPAVLARGVHTAAADRCLAGSSGTLEARDYRGVPAVIAFRWLPDRRLCLVVKVDQAEAFAPVAAFGRGILLIASLALLSAVFLAITLATTITRPIRALQAGVVRFGRGDLEVRLAERSRDELGVLARAFNAMATAIGAQDARLRASEARFRSVTESAHDAIIAADSRGTILSWNAGARTIFGYEADDVVGQPLTVLMPERYHAAHQHGLERLAATGVSRLIGQTVELLGRRKDGSEFPLELALSTWSTQEGHLYSGIIRDISARKQAEQALEERNRDLARANAELEAFSYSVSHDLRAPLRAMDGFSRILLDEHAPHLPPDAQRYVQLVRNGAQQMGALIDDLLTFSRLSRQPLAKQMVAPADLVRRALDDLRSEQDGRCIDIVLGALAPCRADPALLKQVWLNLLANALKFTGQRPAARIEIGCHQENGHPVYSVRDNGVGFDMRYAHKLFGVFQRLHRAEEYEGTGVGLAIVERIVHRHGGAVWAEAEVGKGATFYFTLEGAEVDDGR